jgi:hypothetical protein
MSKELTTDEVRKNFLRQVQANIDYWAGIPMRPDETLRERLESVVFSTLVIIDGESGLPSFILAPDPHPTDKQYNIDNGDDYYPENKEALALIKGDISGSLHDLLHAFR